MDEKPSGRITLIFREISEFQHVDEPIQKDVSAVVLEMEMTVSNGRLKARRIDGKRRYRKHLICTRGMGIRDLALDGEDLVLLTGPTMGGDEVAMIKRWRGAVRVEAAGVVPEDDIETVRELPYRGPHDHPEGLVRWGNGQWLVVYDNPAPERVGANPARLDADIWMD